MESTLLPLAEPIIQLIPEDTVRLSVLWAYKDYYPVVNDLINVYAPEIVSEEGEKILDAKLFYDVSKISVKTIPKCLVQDLLEFIEKAIRNKYYLLLSVDICKISAYSKYRKQCCFPHKICIYGVNSERKCLFCADFFDGKRYGRKEVNYEEFINSVNSLKEHSKTIDFSTGGADWVEDIELFRYLPNYVERFSVTKLKERMTCTR